MLDTVLEQIMTITGKPLEASTGDLKAHELCINNQFSICSHADKCARKSDGPIADYVTHPAICKPIDDAVWIIVLVELHIDRGILVSIGEVKRVGSRV